MQRLILPKITNKPKNIMQINLPGSKSLANRILLLSMLSSGKSIIHNLPYKSDDIQIMLGVMAKLSINYRLFNKTDYVCSIEVLGNRLATIIPENLYFDCANSGTSLRFILSLLTVCNISASVGGGSRMEERPIGDLVDALNSAGAKIEYLKSEKYPPLMIRHSIGKITKIKVKANLSSQYLSSLLLVSWVNGMDIELDGELISAPYVNMTIELLHLVGISVQLHNNRYIVMPQVLGDFEYTIEPDMSAASYFLALSAKLGVMQLNNFSQYRCLQGDIGFIDKVLEMGAVYNSQYKSFELSTSLINQDFDMLEMPDVAMTLLVLGALSHGKMTLTGIASWKVKETDRIIVMASNLTKLGYEVEYNDASITLYSIIQVNQNILVNTYNDHRIAMCFSIFATRVNIIIENPSCVNKTFANYWQEFNKIYVV